jgi:hypothetical protein
MGIGTFVPYGYLLVSWKKGDVRSICIFENWQIFSSGEVRKALARSPVKFVTLQFYELFNGAGMADNDPSTLWQAPPRHVTHGSMRTPLRSGELPSSLKLRLTFRRGKQLMAKSDPSSLKLPPSLKLRWTRRWKGKSWERRQAPGIPQ